MIRLQGRKTVTSRLCKALVTNPHFLLAEVASDSASQPIVGPYSQSVPVSVHQDRIGQAAIAYQPSQGGAHGAGLYTLRRKTKASTNSRAQPAMPPVGQEWCRKPRCQLE